VVGVLKALRAKGIECNSKCLIVKLPRLWLQAHDIKASSTFADGVFKSRQSQWWTSLEHCLHKNFLMIGQPEVESELLSLLDQPVSYKEQVVSISEDDRGVSVNTSLGRTVHGKYAIAADGARSMIRNSLGISFTGTKPEMVWAVLDTFIDTDFPVCSEIITFQLNGQSRVSWIPRERGMARFYILLDGEITQARAEQSIRDHMAPHRIDFVETEWFSTFEGKSHSFASWRNGGQRLMVVCFGCTIQC
jgi:phenol 2-monooxygenase (NADPH)